MSKIKCPSCWQEIDETVDMCPKCGFVFKQGIGKEFDFEIEIEPDVSQIETNYATDTTYNTENVVTARKKRAEKDRKAIVISVLAVITIVVIAGGKSFRSEKTNEYSKNNKYSYDYDDYSYGGATTGREGALNRAKQYLRSSAFSYTGLIEQLEFEGFSSSEATYGADNCGANWKEQALLKARSYLVSSAFSKSGLTEQLEFEGFTAEEAQYGVDNCGANWKEQAVKKAASYIKSMDFSRGELIEQLEFEGFSYDEALYGVEYNGL